MTSQPSPIVRYEPSLRPLVDDFWRRLLGRNWDTRAQERWEWMNTRREHFLVLSGERVVGNATLLRQDFTAEDGQGIPAGWITDFYVSPELKGQGMGKRLTRRLMEECPNLATFGQSQEARHCFSRLGWVGPDWVPLLGAVLPLRSTFSGSPLSFRQVSFEDPSLAEIWSSREPVPAEGDRSVAALRSRFEGRPDGDYEVWVATDGGRPIGWIVLRLIREWRNRRFGPLPVVVVVDVVIARDTGCAQDLATYALGRAARQGAVAVLAIETAGRIGNALRKAGLRSTLRIGPWRVKSLPRKGFMRAPGADPRLSFPVPLSFYDCDAELTF